MIKKISLHLTLFILTSLPILANADSTGLISGNITNPVVGVNSLLDLIRLILTRIIMPIAAVFVVIWIIYAGFKYVMAQGNQAKITEAHKTLLWSLIGAGILLGATAISQVVETTIKAFTQ